LIPTVVKGKAGKFGSSGGGCGGRGVNSWFKREREVGMGFCALSGYQKEAKETAGA